MLSCFCPSADLLSALAFQAFANPQASCRWLSLLIDFNALLSRLFKIDLLGLLTDQAHHRLRLRLAYAGGESLS
ncbi:hypothetical protein [Prochlorococcus marinus]|uniref:hypothetical protein n=1 Tax=Prochlorococcus marinus TaxID=1219 RepID=UPI00059E6C4B|nr:hypothetical protein [Prochlorococcus marinus]